jgi:hypothetical protein
MFETPTDWAAWIGAVTGLAALYQNIAQRRDQRRLQRPFIGIESANLELHENILLAHISFANHGQSIASSLRYEMSTAIAERKFPNASSDSLNFLPPTSQMIPAVGIGGKFWLNNIVHLIDGQPEKFANHELMLFIKGVLYYKDTFGNEYQEPVNFEQGTPTAKKNNWNLGGGVALATQF